MRYSRGLKAISLSMAFVMLFTNTAPLKAYAAGLQEEVQDAMAGETVQVSPEVGTSVEPGSEPQVLALEPTLNPEEIEPQVGSGQDGAQQDNVEATQSPAPATTPAATETPAPATTPEPTVVPTATPEPTATPAPTEMPEATATPKPTAEPSPTETPAVTEIENEIATSESANSLTVPQGAVIEIGTYEELQLLGTGETVDGVTYAADGQYTIAQDIELPSSTAWTLPENFTGRIAPEEPSEDRTVYDAESDTIYVYHRFQLAVMAQENAAEEPVMDGDATAETFGMGQLIYPNGAEQPYLTYSPEHHYVISTQFCSDVPVSTYANEVEVPGPNSDGTRQYEGRDFPGQVIKTINGVDYILIGNADQLRAIGTDAKVYTAAYELKWVDGPFGLGGHYEISTDDNGNPVMVYGGDADLLREQNGTDTYRFQNIDDGVGAPAYGGVDQTTRTISTEKDSWKTEYTYSSDANYIIFRDIDLEKINWTPLMFHGTMTGAKAQNSTDRSTLWDPSSGEIAANVLRPEIKNVAVNQSNPIPGDTTLGVGFFATLSSETEENDINTSKGLVAVSNIALHNVTVDNNATEVEVTETFLSGLLSGLGRLVGAVLDVVLRILGVDLSLKDILSSILDARRADPTARATGAFAGRIVGEVVVERCAVTGTVRVDSVNGLTGGFVGYTTGMAQYKLTGGIGELVRFLAAVLNAIPGLGLGDLITILLGNVIPLDKLIPTGYTSAIIQNCEVNGLQGTLGGNEKECIGGFVGQQIGVRIMDCRVTASNYTIQAAKYGGGFAGLARDAEMEGTLSNLGIEFIRFGEPESILLNCTVESWNPTVATNQSAVSGGSYLGGFVGALANSYTVNCSVTMAENAPLSVRGAGSYVGGWTGTGTLGWVTNLGKNEENDKNLLQGVADLLGQTLGDDETAMILSLAGVAPSAIMGCQINGSSVTVQADQNYAGGFVGNGDGVYLTKSSQDMLQKLSFWRNGTITTYPTERDSALSGLTSVTAGTVNTEGTVTTEGDYAGGIAGALTGASVGGLLNSTVGLGEFLGFTVDGITLKGGYTVTATGNFAGGAFGMAMAGDASNITIDGITSVSARNNAGGFVGLGGPGSLATVGEGGLTLNLLGLDDLLRISNILSVIPGVQMTLTDCTVTGGKDFAVTAEGATGSDLADYAAGGFIGRGNSTDMTNCHVSGLVSVSAPTPSADSAGESGFAGGFVGISRNDDLTDVLNSNGEGSDISGLEADQLLGAAPLMMPTYTNCTVTFADVNDATANVSADVAGGFAADFQSGEVDNSEYQIKGADSPFAVYNISRVDGQTYAGGFAGKLYSGALANSNGGVSILGGIDLDLQQLLTVVGTYVPTVQYAGVDSSKQGLVVTATDTSGETGDLNAGSAGGFAGYASGAQISTCDVNFLRHTKVTDPAGMDETDQTETTNQTEPDPQPPVTDDASYYDDTQSSYAVSGGRYAGGFIGKIDIGSAASVGGGLKILDSISLSSVLEALNVVVTTIEHSDVYGAAGGYAVRADAAVDDKQVGHAVRADATVNNKQVGHAGGFAGVLYGGHIQDSNAHNFSHIIGRQTAGGYVGEMKPGNVASVLDDGKIWGLVDIDSPLSGLEVFVPTIRNSSTDSVPCGGVVWAQVNNDQAKTEGMAGGYVGHNEGGQIRGLDTETWHTVASDDNAVDTGSKVYEGPTSLCKAVRIRTVYGSLYAGGYTGFMEAADTAETGGLRLLGGLINVDNLLSVLKIVYPIQTNTAVYGPLADLDMDTWNSWVDAVGVNGGYGFELARAGKVSSQDELNAKLANYIYGYDVYTSDNDTARTALASAGGYVGLMRSGVLTNCMAYDAKQVQAPGAAGGFAGRMETGGAASFGSFDILGLEIGDLLDVAEVFVPVINNSSVQGYRSGLTVAATGTPEVGVDAGEVVVDAGYAGGFVGAAYGAQIQLNADGLTTTEQQAAWIVAPDQDTTAQYPVPEASCDVRNLRRVAGRSSVGGYAGLATAASLASVNTNASDGLLQGILNKVIRSAGNLIKLLPATVTTIHQASVSPADLEWGFVVDGAYTEGETTQYAPYSGGFVGQAQAAMIGEAANNSDTSPLVTVTGLRQVDGGLYAGGFIGWGDVSAVAEVGGGGADGTQGTTILDSLLGGLLDNAAELGAIDVADVLRTYLRRVSVAGVEEGYRVQAHGGETSTETTGSESTDGETDGSESTSGILSETRYAGAAGGFAGAVLNGTVQYAAASNLANVRARNYTGGFIGYMGKSGIADVDSVNLLDKLAGLNAGVADLFGTQVLDSSVTGYASGIVVQATGGAQPIAGGFAGYGDLGRITNCTVGKPSVEGEPGSLKKVSSDQVAGGFIGQTDMAYLVSLEADSPLVKALLQIVNKLLRILYIGDLENLGVIDIGFGPALTIKLLADGSTLHVSLLGLDISVALVKKADSGDATDVAIITIGDSVIRLPCSQDTPLTEDDLAEVEINLIKGNRTELDACTVTGVANGYDVFAGGADDEKASTPTDKLGSAGGFVGYNHEGKISHSKMVLCDVVKGTADYVGPFTGYNDLQSVYFFNDINSIEGEGNRYSIYRANDPSLAKIVTSGSKQVGDNAVQDTAAGVTYDRYDIEHIVDFEGIVDTDQEDAAGNKGATVQDTFKALDGAVMTNGAAATSEAPALAAYQESGAKAVLMLDTPNDPNPGTMVPEPGVMGDPCSKKVDLKVQKIWDDWFNLWHSRPEDGSITLTIYQQEFTLQEKNDKTPFPQYPAQVENPEEDVTMVWAPAPGADGVKKPYAGSDSDDLDADGKLTLTEADQESTWSAVWSKVLKDAPIYTFIDEDHDEVWDDDEKIAYYVYTVVEENVPAGYTVSYDFYNPIDADDYELTVTNKLNIPLPDTGAGGDAMFVAVGVGILLLGLTLTKRRRPRKGER